MSEKEWANGCVVCAMSPSGRCSAHAKPPPDAALTVERLRNALDSKSPYVTQAWVDAANEAIVSLANVAAALARAQFEQDLLVRSRDATLKRAEAAESSLSTLRETVRAWVEAEDERVARPNSGTAAVAAMDAHANLRAALRAGQK